MAICEVDNKKSNKRYYRVNVSVNSKRRTRDFPFTKKGLDEALELHKEWEMEKLEFKHSKMTKNLVSRRGLFRGISYGTYVDKLGNTRGMFSYYVKGIGKALVGGVHINKHHDFDESYQKSVKNILRYLGVKRVTPETKTVIEQTRDFFYKKYKKAKCIY